VYKGQRATGLTRRRVLYGHVFRNAMLIVVAGFPAAFIHAFFTGSLLIETIFSLDGLGLLCFESGSNRDRHDNIGEGLMGENLGVFLSHPSLQGLPALLEVPGKDGHGPDADEVRKLKQLHKRWMKK